MANQLWVWISHPDISEPAKVTQKSYFTVWAGKGWTIVEDDSVPEEVPTNPQYTTLDDEPIFNDFKEVE